MRTFVIITYNRYSLEGMKEQQKDSQPDLRKSSVPGDKTLNERSNKLNTSSDFKNISKNTKEQSSSSLANKHQSFTKFPPIKKLAEQSSEQASKNISTKRLERERESESNLVKETGIKQQGKKKLNPRKTPLANPGSVMISRFRTYKAFLEYVNLSNNLTISGEKLEIGKKYYIHIGKGNNSTLIKNIMKSRPWWSFVEDPSDSKINFVWTQIRQGDVLGHCRPIKNDQLEDLVYQVRSGEKEEQSEEEEMNKSLMKNRTFYRSHSVNREACGNTMKMVKRNSSRPRDPATTKNIPTLKDLKQGMDFQKEQTSNKRELANPKVWMNYQNLRRIFSQKDMKNLKSIQAILKEGNLRSLTRNKIKSYQGCSSFITHNHLENNWHLSNKKALFLNMKSYYEAKKINPFQYIPVTFHVESVESKEFEEFVEYYNSKGEVEQGRRNSQKIKPKRRNIWLVKPGENTNRGTGIMVSESLEEIKEIIKSETVDSQGRQRTHILQEYILPFLYNKRKFDIRSYVLLTSVNGINKGYWFQEGYIRTACKDFNFKNLSNKFIHLTNDAVQKKCEDYGKFEPGNKISFSDFQRYLDTNEPKLKFWSQAYPEMKKLATDAIKAVHTKINPDKKEFSFEIFGLDFMIDESFKVWLIQANTNPCLQLSCPLLGRIIPSMLQNAFRIAVDPIFPPPGEPYLLSIPRTFVPDNILQINKFQLVFDQVQQGKQLKSLLTNTPNIEIYNIQQQQEEYQQGDKNDIVYKPEGEMEID